MQQVIFSRQFILVQSVFIHSSHRVTGYKLYTCVSPNLSPTCYMVDICRWTQVRLTALGLPHTKEAGGGRQLEPFEMHALGTTKPSFRSNSVFKAPPFCFIT